MRRTLTWSVLVVLGLGLLSSASAAERTVVVDSFFFEDSSPGDGRVVVDRGDTITFRFEGGNEHSATVTGLFDSGVKGGGTTFTTGALTRAGTYSLFCTEHGAETHGTTLVVRGPAGASPSATTRPPTAKPTPTRTATAPKPAPAKTTAAPATVIPAPSTAAAAPRASAPARAAAPVASATPDTALSPAPTVAADPADDGDSYLIPGLVLLLLLLSAGAFAFSRRDPTRRAP